MTLPSDGKPDEAQQAKHVEPAIVQAERAYIDQEQRKEYQREMFAIFFAHTPGSGVDKMTKAHQLVHEAPLVLRRTLVDYLTAIQRVHLGSWAPVHSSAPAPESSTP